MPLVLDAYYLNLAIQIGYFAIAALGLNLLVGCSGQISIGHAAFFGFGAFTSAWLSRSGVPVLFAIPLAGFATTAFDNGVPEFKIRQQTGHKTSRMLEKYIRSEQKARQEAASSLGL